MTIISKNAKRWALASLLPLVLVSLYLGALIAVTNSSGSRLTSIAMKWAMSPRTIVQVVLETVALMLAFIANVFVFNGMNLKAIASFSPLLIVLITSKLLLLSAADVVTTPVACLAGACAIGIIIGYKRYLDEASVNRLIWLVGRALTFTKRSKFDTIQVESSAEIQVSLKTEDGLSHWIMTTRWKRDVQAPCSYGAQLTLEDLLPSGETWRVVANVKGYQIQQAKWIAECVPRSRTLSVTGSVEFGGMIKRFIDAGWSSIGDNNKLLLFAVGYEIFALPRPTGNTESIAANGLLKKRLIQNGTLRRVDI